MRYSDVLSVEGYEVEVRRSARRKRSLSMRYEAGRVIVMTPLRTTDDEVERWVRQKARWVARQAERAPPAHQYVPGERFWFLGKLLTLEHCGTQRGATVSRDGDWLCVADSSSPEQAAAGVRRWYQREAEALLPERFEAMTALLGASPTGLKIRHYTSRWGSCTQAGVIQLNARLVMVPLEVIDYVIIHELCHLRHFNHSRAFWREVENYCADYQSRRSWLKVNAEALSLSGCERS